jgi:predicted membrane GTPase involved in stress response
MADLEAGMVAAATDQGNSTRSQDDAATLIPNSGNLGSSNRSTKTARFKDDDELVEITPKSIRLRKTYLDPNERKRARGKSAAVA